jgi:hypothetical protein
MATISITVSAEFVTAVQQEATFSGLGAQAWAKKIIKEAIATGRLERVKLAAEQVKVNSVQVAAASAEAAYNAAVAAEAATVEALN